VELAHPEVDFAARAAARPPEPERPFPSGRRAIFFDVENTSRPQHIARVIDYLVVDRQGRRTDFVAVGNWRVIGHDTARLLAGHGAQLLHSAPSVGVKDWSDLRIAVAAGVWLGTARPGDVLEIISDDRAFDAVGDVAVGLGIAFRRLSYRALTGAPREAEPLATAVSPEPPAESYGGGGGRRRRGRRGGHARREPAVTYQAAPPPPPPPPPVPTDEAEPHTAPHDELLGIARELIARSSNGSLTLDALANALKSRGFSRPPGSPRLITRLRRLRELAVSRSGHITLVNGAAAPTEPQAEPARTDEAPTTIEEHAEADAEPPVAVAPVREPEPDPDVEDDDNRGNRIGYDDRRRAVEAAQSSRYIDARALTPSSQGNRPGVRPDARSDSRPSDGFRRRRSRRGGRRHRSAPAAG